MSTKEAKILTIIVLILSLPAAIDDLRDVLHVTGSLVRWMDLGVELGLSYPTLKTIEVEQRERVRECLREMLVAWLKKKDNVSKVGEPSWRALKTALRSIGEEDIADKL